MVNTTEIIGTIDAIQTLIENFPMSILDVFGNKVYVNPIELITDILKQLGVNNIVLTNKIIELIFNVPNAVELYGSLSKYHYQLISKPTEEQKYEAVYELYVPTGNTVTSDSPNYIYIEDSQGNKQYYVKKAVLPTEPQSEFLIDLENNFKNIIQTILTGLLSCSIIPEIPNEYMDYTEGGSRYNFVLPKQYFDMTNLLDIYPLSDVGKGFYSGVDDEMLNVNNLYRTNDLNAFIWYVLHRGNTINQTETNKMMWDSRITAERNGDILDKRTEDVDWKNWLINKPSASSASDSGIFKGIQAGGDERYIDAFHDGFNETVDLPLHPILQFEPTDIFGYNNGIKISFPYQTWHKESGIFNKSIYRFNSDYLENIQIFNPRLIISEMINNLLNGNLLNDLNIQYSVQTKIFENKLDEIIKKAIEIDDLTVDDCFYTFSSEDFSNALNEMELQRYNAKQLNSETSPALKIDENFGIDAINEINSMATMNERLTSISKTIYDISTMPAKDGAIEVSDKLSLGYTESWYNEVLMAIIRPIAKAMFTPKVMLIFLINFQIMGLINMDNLIDSFNEVINIILKKMISIVISLVKYVRDKLLDFLVNLFIEYITPLLEKVGILLINEKLSAWINILQEALSCVPIIKFNWGAGNAQSMIDNVNYADITQTQDTPEVEKTC